METVPLQAAPVPAMIRRAGEGVAAAAVVVVPLVKAMAAAGPRWMATVAAAAAVVVQSRTFRVSANTARAHGQDLIWLA